MKWREHVGMKRTIRITIMGIVHACTAHNCYIPLYICHPQSFVTFEKSHLRDLLVAWYYIHHVIFNIWRFSGCFHDEILIIEGVPSEGGFCAWCHTWPSRAWNCTHIFISCHYLHASHPPVTPWCTIASMACQGGFSCCSQNPHYEHPYDHPELKENPHFAGLFPGFSLCGQAMSSAPSHPTPMLQCLVQPLHIQQYQILASSLSLITTLLTHHSLFTSCHPQACPTTPFHICIFPTDTHHTIHTPLGTEFEPYRYFT